MTVHGEDVVREFMGECPECRGDGCVTLSQMKARDAWLASWCRCEEAGDLVYCPDAGVTKHHWVCGDCGGVVQEG